MRPSLSCAGNLRSPETALPDEQRKLVTVLFADLAGWTALGEQLDPEEVQAIQRAYFDAVTPPIEQHGGSVEKYIGDAVLAVFGVPQAHEDDPERAVRAALAMQDAVAALNTTLATSSNSSSALLTSVLLPSVPLPLSLRIGVHTGLVVSSVDESGDFVVTGDTVNLASRLQSAAEPGTVLISAETHRLAGSAFETEAVGPLAVKGKAEPVSAWRVLAIKPAAPKLRGIAGLDSPLVGRAAEMTALREALNYLQRGVGGIVTVVGEAGIGKSRLLAELRKSQQLSDQRPAITVHWLEGRCLSFGATIPYLLWLDVLRSALEVSLDDPSEEVIGRLRAWTENFCPDRISDVFPYLARLMSLPLDAETLADLTELDGQTLKQRTFQAVEIALTCAAYRQPLAVVLEDLHWADPSSLELLQHLVPLIDRSALLLILVFRPHADHGSWIVRETAGRDYHHRHTDLWLQPLSAADSEALVGNLLRVDALPQSLRWRILGRAEGNPFFVEEVIRTLIDMQAIAYDPTSGRWLATRDLAEVPIPETLQGVIAARIDRLHGDTRHVLQLASVIGRIFLYRVLAAIAAEEHALDDRLLALQREELIRERARIPELEYIFKHELTREAAYNGILKRQRKQFHRQVAEALERLFPDRVDEMAGLLAYHWERAEEFDKATGCLLTAGEQAQFAYALHEAAGFYERALLLLAEGQDADRQAHVSARLGIIHQTAGDYKRSRAAFQNSFVFWEQASSHYLQWGSSSPPAPHPLRFPADEPERLCPITIQGGHNWRLLYHLFRGLNRWSSVMDTNALADVASSWEVSEDGRRYLFGLRQNTTWSDGTRVSAGDFEYAWRYRLDPGVGAAMAPMLDFVQGARAFRMGEETDPASIGVHALDDVTLSIETEKPLTLLPYLVANLPTYPVPRHTIERYGEAWTDPDNLVTNGPFRLESWRRGESMTVGLDPGYDRPVYGNIRQVQLYFLPDAEADLAMYQADLLDVIDLSGFPLPMLDDLRRRYSEEFRTLSSYGLDCLIFQTSRPPFDDPQVRRAFVHAVDIEKLANKVLMGYELPATMGLFPPGFPGHSSASVLAHDPEQAQALLAKAGYPAGRGLPVVELLAGGAPGTAAWSRRTGFNTAILDYVATQWREVLGADIDIQLITYLALRSRLKVLVPDVRLTFFEPNYPDPESFLSLFSTFSLWKDSRCEHLLAAARKESDIARRMALFEAAHKHILDEATIVPLLYRLDYYLMKPWNRVGKGGRYWQDFVLLPH
ncbi:MAG: ABC transporter substrate-binding protein [Caldilineales bacterium]